jgi:hypothetical protein
MRKLAIHDVVPLYRLTAGRRKVALERCAIVAAAIPEAALISGALPGVITLQVQALVAASTWQRAQTEETLHDAGAVDLHNQVSRVVVALCGTLQGLADVAEPDLAALAADALAALFPRGPKGNVQLAYVEQNQQLEVILDRLDSAEFAAHRAALPLELHLAALRRLNPLFGAKLSRPLRMPYEVARLADRAAEAGFLGVYGRIVGTFPGEEEPDLTHRSALLEPIFDQIDGLIALRASRRPGDGLPATEPTEAEQLAEDVALDAEIAVLPLAPTGTD